MRVPRQKNFPIAGAKSVYMVRNPNVTGLLRSGSGSVSIVGFCEPPPMKINPKRKRGESRILLALGVRNRLKERKIIYDPACRCSRKRRGKRLENTKRLGQTGKTWPNVASCGRIWPQPGQIWPEKAPAHLYSSIPLWSCKGLGFPGFLPVSNAHWLSCVPLVGGIKWLKKLKGCRFWPLFSGLTLSCRSNWWLNYGRTGIENRATDIFWGFSLALVVPP